MIWEGEDGTVRRLSYAELHAETCRLAGAMRRLGIGRGDRVGLFLPMVPEAVVAFLACAKIGAISIPIFSGFGAQAVAARLEDGQAVALITADVSFRRGKAIHLEPVAARPPTPARASATSSSPGARGLTADGQIPTRPATSIGTSSSQPSRPSIPRSRSTRKPR